ncbi:hypothetical protein BH20ACI2_BH20ACI2_21440 [soil metagenome]
MVEPYPDPHPNRLHEMSFCDDIELSTAIESSEAIDLSTNDGELRRLIFDPSIESRQKILAASLLSRRGIADPESRLFGVIVEVSLKEGLDVLAVYEDGTARYINYSGKIVIWETVTSKSRELSSALFSAVRQVDKQIRPWDGERLPPPVVGNARLSFLVGPAIYFGEGPFEVLAVDPMGGAVIERASEFMAFLVERVTQSP